jgi:hypothetical protein
MTLKIDTVTLPSGHTQTLAGSHVVKGLKDGVRTLTLTTASAPSRCRPATRRRSPAATWSRGSRTGCSHSLVTPAPHRVPLPRVRVERGAAR